jgi:DNA mismatch repair protein MutS2
MTDPPAPFRTQRREIQAIKEKFFPSFKMKSPSSQPDGIIKTGDRVRIVSLRSEGVLQKVEEDENRVEVMTEKGKVKASLSDIVKIEAGAEERGFPKESPVHSHQPLYQDLPTSIHIMGLTVEDAIPEVDRFIDQALLHGLEKVQIIHGVGSGKLRGGIHKYLRNHPGVIKFGLGEGTRGGAGVTLVELR